MPPEVLAYSRYFSDYIAAGGALDLVLTLHNVEANESKNVICPFINVNPLTPVDADLKTIATFNGAFFQQLRRVGFLTDDPTRSWAHGVMLFRLFGKLSDQYGAQAFSFEVNDRYPASRLSHTQLQEIGKILAGQCYVWCVSEEGRQRHHQITQHLTQFRQRRQIYLDTRQIRPDGRTPHELVSLGY